MPATSTPSDAPVTESKHDLNTIGKLNDYTRKHGVNKFVYLTIRLVLQPFFMVYLRLGIVKAKEFPQGGVLVIANHRSFLDPFLIACMLPWNRSLHFMSKAELFARPRAGWIMNRGGAFPVRRGESDPQSMETARQILERGGVLVIFPEGERKRFYGMGDAKRGAFRLAQETGATVLPVTLTNTDKVRHHKFIVLPIKCKVHAGEPIPVTKQTPTPDSAAALRDEAWAQVRQGWLDLGGTPITGVHHRPEDYISSWRFDQKSVRALKSKVSGYKQRTIAFWTQDIRFWRKSNKK